jgi:hypothetical protein
MLGVVFWPEKGTPLNLGSPDSTVSKSSTSMAAATLLQ